MPTTAEKNFIQNRVNMPTAKSSRDLSLVPAQIRARAFFSARVAEAHILDKLRQVSDDYSSGKIELAEAKSELRAFLGIQKDANGMSKYDIHQTGLRHLASHTRLNLILEQNRKMAKAAGDYARMYKPANLKMFPYVRYHASVGSRNPRSEHGRYDGMIFHKDDPWLKTHWPPWDFGCNCELENLTEEEAQEDPGRIQPKTPLNRVTVDSKSGFSFDPAHAFDEYDLTRQTPISRTHILEKAAEAVKDGKLGNVGLITAPATAGDPPAPLPNLNQVKQGFDAMKNEARSKLQAVGLDPDNLPDYKTVNQAFKNVGKQGKDIENDVLDLFPSTPIEVAKLNQRAEEAAGLPANVPVMLGRGNGHHGIVHLWRNHKEIFADPDKAIQLLQETLGDPNCRVVVSLKRVLVKFPSHGGANDLAICLKRIVLHNPEKKTYCVMVYDGKELKLVSWNNAGDDYGNEEWSLA